MANELSTGLAPDLDGTAAAEAAARSVRTFDPAELLTRPRGVEPPPAVAVPGAEAIRVFDPAANLGAAARRGPAMIGDGKPLVARIGGVEVVTVPLEHYAALVSPVALARPGVVTGDGTPDAEGMLLFLLSLHAEGTVSIGQLAQTTKLDHLDLADRIAAYGATASRVVPVNDEPAPVEVQPPPEATTIDLPSGLPEVVLTPGEMAATYDAAVQRGDTPGGAMDRAGQPAEPAGKSISAHNAERGSTKRSRR